VSNHNISVVDIKTIAEASVEIENIGSDPESIKIMAPKAIFRVIKLENIVLQDAVIIKQDMLSVGGEVAISKEAFKLKEKSADILVMGTLKQLRELVGKLNRHYPRIKNISKELSLLLDNIC
jgi:dihydropteroate synthase